MQRWCTFQKPVGASCCRGFVASFAGAPMQKQKKIAKKLTRTPDARRMGLPP
jgi:hypothetical protein